MLGGGPGTIKDYGCYLTSMATLAKACGKTITPWMLNQAFLQNQLFVGMMISSDDDLTKVFPDIIYQQTLHYEQVPADLTQLKTLMDDPTMWVILEIDLGNGNTHFVLCLGVNGVISIADPETGACIDFASKYGDPATNILKFVVYKGTPASVDSTALQSLQSQLKEAEGVNQQQTQTISTLQLTLKQQQEDDNAKILDLTTQNGKLQTQIDEYTTEIKTLNEEVGSAADLAAKASTQKSSVIESGIKAKSVLEELQERIQLIASYFHLNKMDEKQVIEWLLDKTNKYIEQQKKKTIMPTQSVNTNNVQSNPTVSMAIKAEEIKKKQGLFSRFINLWWE